MKKIKLNQTVLCQIILYSPAISLFILGLVCLVLNNLWGILLFFIFLGLALVYLLRFFPLLLASEFYFSEIRGWKKDRLWFSLEYRGTDLEKAILSDVQNYGVSCEQPQEIAPAPLCVQYKRSYPFTAEWSSVERIIIAYRVSHLSGSVYEKTMKAADRVIAQLKRKSKPFFLLTKKEQEAPVCRVAAVLIFADYTEPEGTEMVRRLPENESMAVLPCVIDLCAKRCYFDGMEEPNVMGTKPPKNRAIDLVRKVVFSGRLPLEENSAYNYAKMPTADPEKSLYDYVKEYVESGREDRRVIKQMAETMGNGELVFKDNVLYLKRGDRVAEFLIEDEGSEVAEILLDEYWSYPKHHKIAKADLEDLKAQVKAFFAMQAKQVRFLDEPEY